MFKSLRVHVLFDRRYQFRGFVGFMVRGIFGYALRKVSCRVRRLKDCSRCVNRFDCPYYYIFETAPDVVPEPLRKIARKMKGITKPFSITIDEYRGRRLVFTLNLIGPRILGMEHVVVSALKVMEEHGLGYDRHVEGKRRFKILSIDAVNPLTGYRVRVYTPGKGYIIDEAENSKTIAKVEDYDREAERLVEKKPRVIIVQFRTPTMLTEDGTPTTKPKFRTIMANLTRKYSITLNYHFEREPLTLEEASRIIELAGRIEFAYQPQVKKVWLERFSVERARWEKYGPFIVGTAIYRIPEGVYSSVDVMKQIFKLLLLSKVLHVGKLVTAGLGQIVVRIM